MARKTVRVTSPSSIDDVVLTFERMILRNDGVLPPVPQSTAYITLGGLLGLVVPPVSTAVLPSSSTPPPGTHKISEAEIAAPMRAMYPAMKRAYLDLVALRELVQTTSGSLQQLLGMLPGQTLATTGTARSLIDRAIAVLLGVYAGNENELETYGLKVTVGTAAIGKRKPKPPKP